MDLGPSVGTLAGTLERTPMCALWAHVVPRDDYGYLVPYVEDEHTVCLKTIIPSLSPALPVSPSRCCQSVRAC
jgi:hypothetical protein